MKKLLIMGGVMLLAGCAMNPGTMRDVTAAELGCAPVDVAISNYQATFPGPQQWTATCKGKTYSCQSRMDANKSTANNTVTAATCHKM